MQNCQHFRLNEYVARILISSAFQLIVFCLTYLPCYAQQNISGTITGADGLPLAGASVSVKGATTGTTSDANGVYFIQAQKADVLIFSNIGYQSQQILVSGNTKIDLALIPQAINLDEVVLTGYTYQRVKDITGSVSVVRSKDLTAVPAGQVEQMLQGRVAGLTVITSGEPGSASNVRLHGIGNFGDVTPLYIIDGIEGDINLLNPYDIESLQVLKDAGAYSIYGVRGANGVIIVTTKKGKNSKTKINYDFYIGTTRPLKHGLDLLSPQEQADLLWMALKNSYDTTANGNPSDPRYGNGPKAILPDYLFAGPYFDTLYEGSPYVNPDLYNLDSSAGQIYQIERFSKKGTDWFHETFKPALTQNHTLSVTGGNTNNHYLFSLGYLDQQGTLINTFLKRYTARVNTEFSAWNNTIRIGENLQLSYSRNPKTGNFIYPSLMTDPFMPVYDIKGNWSSLDGVHGGPLDNPLAARILSKDDRNNNWQIFGNAYAELDVFKKITLRSSFGGNVNYYYVYNFGYGSYAPPPLGFNSSLTEISGYANSSTWTNTATYSETFHHYHHVKLLVGIENKNNYNRELGGGRANFFTSNPNYRFLSNGDPSTQTNYSIAATSVLSSFISQLNYNFNDKIFISGTLRRDGSSVFGPENRFGWFPSVSAAWRLTEEKFTKPITWLSDLKIRASWGKTGFAGNTNPFNQYTLYGGTSGSSYYDIYGTSNSVVQGFYTVRTGNPKTGWQEDIVTNIGIESLLWNGKLSASIDWYNKKSTGLLFQATLPAILGGAIAPNINIGNVVNKGIDVQLGSKGKFSKNAGWDVTVNFSHYQNKVLHLNNIPFFDDYYTRYGPFIRNEVGYPISSFYGYKIIGIFKNQHEVDKSPVQDAAKPGRFKYLDADHDGVITENDRVHFGSPNPKFTLGINVGFTFKNVDFSSFFYGSFGNDVLNDLRYATDVFPSELTLTPKSKTALYDSWTPQRINAKAPLVENDQNFSNAGVVNSYALEKGTYFRNKIMSIGYSFTGKFLEPMRVERLRLYIQSANLFTITKYTGLDPELSGTSSAFGVDSNGNYPNNQKQWILGINLSL